MARRGASPQRGHWLRANAVGLVVAWLVIAAERPLASGLPPEPFVPAARAAQAAAQARPVDVAVPGDRPLRLVPGAPGQRRTIVYLHGMCGAEEGADAWAKVATAYGTLVTVRADVPCGDRPGYKWPKDPALIELRIQRALEVVRARPETAQREDEIWLIGYSQGAHRAERLAAAYPHRYRTLVLGGPPTAASPERLRHSRRVAILGGELEDTSHMVEGYLALYALGLDAEFFTLPRAGHGSFGPDGRRVMGEVLAYLAR